MYGGNENGLGDTPRLTMLCDITGNLAAAGECRYGLRSSVQRLNDRKGVGGIMIHVVPLRDLRRAAVATAVMATTR